MAKETSLAEKKKKTTDNLKDVVVQVRGTLQLV